MTNSFYASSSLRSNSIDSISSNKFSSYKQNESINSSNLDYWKKMKEKCEKVNLLFKTVKFKSCVKKPLTSAASVFIINI